MSGYDENADLISEESVRGSSFEEEQALEQQLESE